MSPEPDDSMSEPSPQTKEDSQDVSKLKEMTAAEQMAHYENELKENDWGHQPC